MPDREEEIKERASKARKRLKKIKTYKSKKKSFPGSLGVGVSAIRKRRKEVARIMEKLKE